VPDSSQSFHDWTFNTSLAWQVNPVFSVLGLVGRGFRAPNVNDLGTVGARTLGYDVTIEDARAVNALFGLDASDTAGLNTKGSRVGGLNAETLLNYEISFRVNTRRFYGRVGGFDAELIDSMFSRTLLFPAGQVPPAIGGVPVFPLAPSPAQQAAGVVAVATTLTPRAVHTVINEGRSRYMGIESLAELQISNRWRVGMNYTFLSGRDLNPVRNIRRLPPQEGGFRIWYTPSGRRPRFLINSRFTGPQLRLNGADIDDDRIGASRRRSDIAAFFRAGVVSLSLLRAQTVVRARQMTSSLPPAKRGFRFRIACCRLAQRSMEYKSQAMAFECRYTLKLRAGGRLTCRAACR
jgi:outer membrane receptor protein involved in Fe transport